MGKIPEGREPLPDEWFNQWPNVDDFSEPDLRKTPMYTVEFESDATIITSLDDSGKYDDIQVIIGDNGGVYLRQFDEVTDEHSIIYISYKQFLEILRALNSSEGAYRMELNK